MPPRTGTRIPVITAPPLGSCSDTSRRLDRAEQAGPADGQIQDPTHAFSAAATHKDRGGTTLFNRLKKPSKGPTWSHFKNLTKRLEWLDELGDTDVWMGGVAAGKVTDFAGEADAADASELRDFVPVKRIALVAALTHEARMWVRDDLATMFCKRVAMKVKKAKAELEEIRLAEREIVEALIGNYRTVLSHIDEGGPAQEALAKAAAMTAEARQALEGLDEEASVDEVATRLEGRVSLSLPPRCASRT